MDLSSLQLHRRFQQTLSALLSRLAPKLCVLCKARSNETLCSTCEQYLPRLSDNQCRLCALPLLAPGLCPECQQKPPSYQRLFAVFEYSGDIKTLMWQYKQSMDPHICDFFTGALASLSPFLDGLENPLVVYPPSSRANFNNRLGNPAAELARRFAVKCRLEWADVFAPIQTTAQKSKTRKSRQRIRSQQFQLRTPKIQMKIKNRDIILVDDIATTTSTINAMTAKLHLLGANRVYVMCVARTGKSK